ncbi:NACHT C-terminal alpha/beta 1 domain-containing protein [Coleofasciculus sp. G2-EDA-02]|uniref:NACHT C-terminal alpha/beta 1 domain-containing protein n=1 Tax=Coleofasciculus sp. G2-EDA-02 TaxID=3069529 RepID=UPI0032FC0CA0
MWKWTKTEYRVLSAFANLSKHSEVFNYFKNELPFLNELRNAPDGCRRMVEAIYNTLAKRAIQYSLEEYDSSQDSQQIREPAEIIDINKGTCLDLAVLFCGICLRYELIPLLVVTRNHAWVAVSLTHWLHECKASDREGKKLFNEGLLTNKENLLELCNLVEDEEAYIAIECTGYTKGSLSKSFDQAEQEGLNRLRDFSSQNGSFILDIPIANDVYWHDLCHNRLEAETPKRFINNPLTSGENPLLKLYVPLGLIERKPDAQRRPRENASPPEASPFNQPDDQYEVVQKYDGEAFLEQVLKHKHSRSQGKRLAIVGDPGGGKTTLLQRIAYWVLEKRRGLPIWIPLASVYEEWERKDEGWLYHYLSKEWLKNIAGESDKVPVEWQHLFAELLESGQVWLLLDGADEMAIKSPLMRIKEQLAKGWADSVRVVLNCRLNLWEVEKEALWETFDIYRTLDFSYPEQVHQFINNWFGEGNPEANELQDKLAEENRKRLQDLLTENEVDIIKLDKLIKSSNDIHCLVGLLKKDFRQTLNDHQSRSIILLVNNRLVEIASRSSEAVTLLLEIIHTSQDKHICQEVAFVLGKAASRNIDATKAVIKLLKTTKDESIAEYAIECLKKVFTSDLLAVVVEGLKDYIEDTECYKLIWHCAQNMPYPDFYKAWHPQEEVGNTTTLNSQSLNQANLQESLQSAIANEPQLNQTIHLICIDTRKFIDPNNPAAKIYVEMVKQGCCKSDDGTPKTMQDLQVYWDLLTIESNRTIVLVFYTSSDNPTPGKGTALPYPYSDTFLTDLSRFEGAICIITDQPFDHIPLKYFTPSQPIADVVDWIRAIATGQ